MLSQVTGEAPPAAAPLLNKCSDAHRIQKNVKRLNWTPLALETRACYWVHPLDIGRTHRHGHPFVGWPLGVFVRYINSQPST